MVKGEGRTNCTGRWQREGTGKGCRRGGILKSVLQAQLGRGAGRGNLCGYSASQGDYSRAGRGQLEGGGEENWRVTGGLGVCF